MSGQAGWWNFKKGRYYLHKTEWPLTASAQELRAYIPQAPQTLALFDALIAGGKAPIIALKEVLEKFV